MATPIVSFVVINYNYEDYLAEAIDSVLAQDYPDIECLVVDNASTDGSRDVLARYEGMDARLSIRRFDRNLNQMGALLKILDDLRGRYLTIVDADDFIFPNYASRHVLAHELAPRGLAFTSSCVVEVDGAGSVLTAGYDPFLSNVAEARLADGEANAVEGVGATDRALLLEAIRLVDRDDPKWRWSPGTANMHDLALVRATRPIGHAEAYVGATDNYFMWLNHAIAGSAQILTPLSAYRHHGRNRYGAMPSVAGLTVGTRSGVNRSAVRRRDITLALASRARAFQQLAPGRFWKLMDAPAAADGQPVGLYFANPLVQKILFEHRAELLLALGAAEVERELAARMGRRAARRIARA